MNYQELVDVLGQNQNAFSGVAPRGVNAPTIDQIISGISSQYEPINLGTYGPSVGGAGQYITGSPNFGDIEQVPEYGRLNQITGPSFVPSAFNENTYRNIDSQRLSDVISQISNDYGGSSDGVSGANSSIDGTGFVSSPNIGTMGVTLGAGALGALTGLPLGFAASVAGKQNIANAINNAIHGMQASQNQALAAAQLGLANTPENAAAIAAAIDSALSSPPGTTVATTGPAGTGSAAAQASEAAAAIGQAMGMSPAAIGAMSQEAANNALSGMNVSNSVSAAVGQSEAAATGMTTNAEGQTVSNDASIAAQDASVSGGGSSSSKIICTAMNHAYGFGSFRNSIWLAYADKHLTKAHEVGYHTLFLPLVDYGFKRGDGRMNMVIRKILEWGTRHRSTDLRAEMRGTKRDTTGRIIRFIFEPLCYAVGKLKGY